jgi:hypothetical protein
MIMKQVKKLAFAAIAMLLSSMSLLAAIPHQTGDVIAASTSMTSVLENKVSMSTTHMPKHKFFIAADTNNPTTLHMTVTVQAYASGSSTPVENTVSLTVYSPNSGFVNTPVEISYPSMSVPMRVDISITTRSSLGSGYRCDFECYYNTAVD